MTISSQVYMCLLLTYNYVLQCSTIVSKYSNPGLFRTLLALTRSSQLSLAMASHVCAAAKHKYRRMIWLFYRTAGFLGFYRDELTVVLVLLS